MRCRVWCSCSQLAAEGLEAVGREIAVEVGMTNGGKWRLPHECGNHRYERFAVGCVYAPHLQPVGRKNLLPIAIGKVTARDLYDAVHFPIAQVVSFDEFRGFEHCIFFRGLVQADVNVLVLLFAIAKRAFGDQVADSPRVLFENGQEKHSCRVLMRPKCW